MGMSMRFEIFPADLNATAAFYTTVLGFELTRDERDADRQYLALKRDGVQVGAAARPEVLDRHCRRPPTGVELVFEVDDVDSVFEHVRVAGWPTEEELVERPWGLRDFRLLDPSGYYLRITERFP
jgi:lactoylglutathione lyase